MQKLTSGRSRLIWQKAASPPHTDSIPHTLQWDTLLFQNRSFPWGHPDPHLIYTWFLGPTRLYNPKGISIGSAVYAELTIMADWQTDRQTGHSTPSVTKGCIYTSVVLRCSLKVRLIPLKCSPKRWLLEIANKDEHTVSKNSVLFLRMRHSLLPRRRK